MCYYELMEAPASQQIEQRDRESPAAIFRRLAQNAVNNTTSLEVTQTDGTTVIYTVARHPFVRAEEPAYTPPRLPKKLLFPPPNQT